MLISTGKDFFRCRSYTRVRQLVLACLYAWLTKLELKNRSKILTMSSSEANLANNSVQ